MPRPCPPVSAVIHPASLFLPSLNPPGHPRSAHRPIRLRYYQSSNLSPSSSMAAQVVAAAGAAAAARPLGGGSGADGLRPSSRLQLGTCASRERWSGAAATRCRRDTQVVSVISRAPRTEAEVLPVSPDDDAAVKVAPPSSSSYRLIDLYDCAALAEWRGTGQVSSYCRVVPIGRRNWLSLTVKLDLGSLSCLRW